jgi:hypothetical protein
MLYTVKPLSIVFQGDGKQKRYIRENDSTGKQLKIIDKNNLMIIFSLNSPCIFIIPEIHQPPLLHNYITHRHKTTHYNVKDKVPNSYSTHHPIPSRANSITINIVQCMISWNIKKCKDTVNSVVLTFYHFNYILYSRFYLYMFL